MCGIAGVYFRTPSSEFLDEEEIDYLIDWLLIGIEPRGDHATGVSVMDWHGITSIEKSDLPATQFCNWRRPITVNPRTILLHTRWATKGDAKNLLNNHPIEYGSATVIHNGHIRNDDELFKEEGLDRIAQVDSEIIAGLLDKHGFDDAKSALEKLEGNFAIAAHDRRVPNKLLLAKGPSSPLVYMETTDAIYWASTEKCLKDSLQFGIGYEVKDSELKNLGYGEFLMIDGDEIIKDKFSPKYKKTTTYTSWSGYNKQTVYSDGWYMDMDWCDGCSEELRKTSLKKIGRYYYCWTCEKEIFGLGTNPEKKGKRWRKKMRKAWEKKQAKKVVKKSMVSRKSTPLGEMAKGMIVENDKITEILNDEHWLVCELVAEKYGTTPEFVDHLLFDESDVVSSDDPNFVSIFMAFEESYTDLMKEVAGNSDGKGMEIVPFKQNKMPLGF